MNPPYEQPGRRRDGAPRGPAGQQPRQDNEDIKAILKWDGTVRYRDAQGDLRRDLLDKEAQEAAETLGDISTTQLRRFFEQVSAIKRRIDLNHDISDGEILAQVAFVKASAAYALGRNKEGRDKAHYEQLLKFVVKHVNSISSQEDFSDFHRHFETVVAFHRVYAKDKKDN